MVRDVGSDLIFFSNDLKSNQARNKAEEKEKRLVELLKLFSPGTSIRTALDDMMRARMGALIAVDKKGFFNIVDGGFRVNCKFSPQRLVELAKMDGAIILSNDLKKIIYANTLLVPDMKVGTSETGTRHKAAERTSKQINTLVIAVSERKNKITLYWGDICYVLERSSEILRRAAETLQILEKQKEISDDSISNLNILEINNLVTISDVCNVLQRVEAVKRISNKVKRYLVELGREGIIVSMRLKELTKNLKKERLMILQDYFGGADIQSERILTQMNFDDLLETSNLSKELFGEVHDKSISPQGLRILSKTNLDEKNVKLLIDRFKTLEKIFEVDKSELIEALEDEENVDSLRRDLESLREKILVGKKI